MKKLIVSLSLTSLVLGCVVGCNGSGSDESGPSKESIDEKLKGLPEVKKYGDPPVTSTSPTPSPNNMGKPGKRG